jgi:predicted phage tail protein
VYNITLSKPISKFTNNITSVKIEGDSYYHIYSNLMNLFPDLKKITNELKFNKYGDIWFIVDGQVLPIQKIFLKPKSNSKIVLVPIIAGGGEEGLMIGVGIALVALAVVTMQPEVLGLALGAFEVSTVGGLLTAMSIQSTVAGGLLSLGISAVAGGVLAAVSPSSNKGIKNPTPDSGARVNNDSFEGLENTTSTQSPIPLIYGQHRVAGQFISGKIKTISHDRSAVIKVSNYI